MKKFAAAMLLLTLTFLCGCAGGSAVSFGKDVGDIELIRIICIDKTQEGITLTAGTGVGLDESAPKHYRASAETAAAAMSKLENNYLRGSAFFSHTEHMVIGEEAAKQGISAYLDFLAREMQLRLDTNIFIVKGSAEQLLLDTASETTSASDMLSAMEKEILELSEGYVYTCGDVMSSLAKEGNALIQAISATTSPEEGKDEEKISIKPSGYAVIKDGLLLEFLDEETSKGATAATGKAQRGTVAVADGEGGYATMEITSTDVEYNAVYGKEKVDRVDMLLTVKADVRQLDNEVDLSNKEIRKALATELAEKEYIRLRAAVDAAQRVESDYLGIGKKLRMRNPDRFDACGWEESFGAVAVNITVNVSIKRTYDLRQPIELNGQGGGKDEG